MREWAIRHLLHCKWSADEREPVYLDRNHGAGGVDGAIFNNSRIGDLSRRINDMRDLLRVEMSKNHSEMLHRFADLDDRPTRVEQRIERIL